MSLKKASARNHLWSACLGNFFEHYDTALFGFLSTFLAPLIFPNYDFVTALILTYAMIPLGMLARPVGALVFGYIGDKYGRREALFLSLCGMGLLSGLTALSPTFAQVGWLAPLIFCFTRILQNFLSSGEAIGGAIFLLENTPRSQRDLMSSLFSASTIGGILLASFGVSILGQYGILETGWRWLYLFGFITAVFGVYIRSKLPEDADITLEKSPKVSLVQSFLLYKKSLLLIIVVSGFAYANYSMSLVLMNGFIPLISSFTKEEMITINSFLLILDFFMLPLFGWLSSKTSKEVMMIGAALAIGLTSIPCMMMLENASFMMLLVIRVCFVIFGVAFFAPFHAWAQDLVPASHRYIIISFGYAVGSQLIGGPTAALSLWMFQKTGLIASVAWYWSILGVLSSGVVLLTVPSKNPQPIGQN